MRGPEGDLGPLDPATKVLEFESLGIKVGAPLRRLAFPINLHVLTVPLDLL